MRPTLAPGFLGVGPRRRSIVRRLLVAAVRAFPVRNDVWVELYSCPRVSRRYVGPDRGRKSLQELVDNVAQEGGG